jgi:uncharacterized OB-fold protein
MAKQIPIVGYLVLNGGEAHLEAHECSSCGALYYDRRNACAGCGGRSFGVKQLATSGTVRSFTIVTRTAPGVPAPYVSAVVDLDGGGSVKCNILDADPTPEGVTLGMPVRLSTFVAGTDDDGTEAIGFGFAPKEGALA